MEPFDPFAGMRKMIENIQTVQNSFAQSAAQAANALAKMASGLDAVTETFRKFSAQISHVLEEHKTNIKTGWWYPNFIIDDLPSHQVDEAMRNEETTGEFTKLIVKECHKDNQQKLKQMYARWDSYKFLPANRRKILLDALQAHMERKYTLSIPVSLAQIEHFHHKLFPKGKEKTIKLKGKSMDIIIGEQQANFARQFGLDDYGKIPANYYFQLYPIYYYFENVLFANVSLRAVQKSDRPDMYKMSDPNNRHAILHGERATYPSEKRSLKQILFLDKILYEMSELIKEDRL